MSGDLSRKPIARSIRDERQEDAASVDVVIRAAFGGGEVESSLVAALRQSGELEVSLVADPAGDIVGHIAFARAAMAGSGAHLAWLAPLSVIPSHENRGIGRELVEDGLRACVARGVTHAIVLGDPAYDGRFGFSREAVRALHSRWQGEALLALRLGNERAALAGEIVEPAAFAVFG